MKQLLSLFAAFFKIGGMTFGGGYAMLPMLRRVIVEKNGWATEDELLDYYAVSQCTPGAIAVNVATFIGCRRGGAAGGVAATLGVIAPSFIIITLIAALLRGFADYPAVAHAFSGIRVAVCVLIIQSLVKLAKSGVKDALGVIIACAAFALSALLGLSPVWTVLGAGALGLIASRIRRPAK